MVPQCLWPSCAVTAVADNAASCHCARVEREPGLAQQSRTTLPPSCSHPKLVATCRRRAFGAGPLYSATTRFRSATQESSTGFWATDPNTGSARGHGNHYLMPSPPPDRFDNPGGKGRSSHTTASAYRATAGVLLGFDSGRWYWFTIAERSLVSTQDEQPRFLRLSLDRRMYCRRRAVSEAPEDQDCNAPLSGRTHQFFSLFDDLAGSSGGCKKGSSSGGTSRRHKQRRWAANTLRPCPDRALTPLFGRGLFYSGILVTRACLVPTIMGTVRSLAAGSRAIAFIGATRRTRGSTLTAAASDHGRPAFGDLRIRASDASKTRNTGRR